MAETIETKPAGAPPVVGDVGASLDGGEGGELVLRLYVPVTEGRAHRGALGSLAEAENIARCREGGGQVRDWRVLAIDVELPVGVVAAGGGGGGGGGA